MYNEVRVFVENKPGKLYKIASILRDANIDIINLEIDDEGQFGLFKILTAEPERTKQALEGAGMTAAFNSVAIIEITDRPGGLVELAEALQNLEINVSDAYGCILERGKRAIFVVKGESLDKIEEAARQAGLNVLNSLE